MISRETTGDILVLRIGHGKANALDLELCEAIKNTLSEAQTSAARAVILTGSGTIFSAGVDLFRLTSAEEEYVARFLPALRDALLALFEFPRPLIAAVNGHAIAGGCLMAAACDYRVMSGGRMGVPELLVGVPFPGVAIEILRYAAGRDAAWLAMSGRTVEPEEAQRVGLIDEVVIPDQLLTRAVVIAEQLAAIPSENFAITKRQLHHASMSNIEALQAADERSAEIWKSSATHANIRAYLDRTVRKK